MNKIILTGTILATITVLGTILATSEFVQAEKPIQIEKIPTSIELTPVGSSDGFLLHRGSAALYFGTELCGIFADTERSIYVQFATDTLVKHGVSTCQGNSNDLDLQGDVDANFKVGDILVFDWFPSEPQRWIEVHREQTI